MNLYDIDFDQPSVSDNPEPEVLTAYARSNWDKHRNADCVDCDLHQFSNIVCMFGNGAKRSQMAVIGDYPTPEDVAFGPFSVAAHQWAYLYQVAMEADVDLTDVYKTYAVRCAPPRSDERDKEVLKAAKACGPYLWRELWEVRPKTVLTLGAASYYMFTHLKGVSKNRGQAFQFTLPCACSHECCEGTGQTTMAVGDDVVHTLCGCKGVCHAHEGHTMWVVPSLNPGAVLDKPSLAEAFVSDIAKWRRIGLGIDITPEVEVIEVHSLAGLEIAKKELLETYDRVMTFDLETRGFIDQKETYAKVWCAAFSTGAKGEHGTRVFQIPIEHPDSPWFDGIDYIDAYKTVYEEARPAVEMIVDLVFNHGLKLSAHNGKFDLRHMIALAKRYAISITLK